MPVPDSEQGNDTKAAKSKSLPVLPWMRVPISIEAGTGVPLSEVRGLHPLAMTALQAGGFPVAACSVHLPCDMPKKGSAR